MDGEYLWAIWLGVAIVLGGAELFSLDLVLAMLAVGALVGMVAALASAGLVISGLLAAAAAVASLALLHPPLINRLHAGPTLTQGHDKLLGTQGIVVNAISGSQTGQVRIGGELWTAAPYDATLRMAPGETVEVLQIKGATALVHPVPSLDS